MFFTHVELLEFPPLHHEVCLKQDLDIPVLHVLEVGNGCIQNIKSRPGETALLEASWPTVT